jgi:hypothetical protein
MLTLAAKSAEVRAQKRSASPVKETLHESNRDETTTDHRPAT